MTTIYRATLETRNFEFEAFGETEGSAFDALCQGLRTHCKQYKIGADDFFVEFMPEVVVRPIEMGGAYRDGQPL